MKKICLLFCLFGLLNTFIGDMIVNLLFFLRLILLHFQLLLLILLKHTLKMPTMISIQHYRLKSLLLENCHGLRNRFWSWRIVHVLPLRRSLLLLPFLFEFGSAPFAVEWLRPTDALLFLCIDTFKIQIINL